jgi:hypothetical protein
LLDNLRRVVGGVEMEVNSGIIAIALFQREMHVKAADRRGLMIPLAWRFHKHACCFGAWLLQVGLVLSLEVILRVTL